MTKLGQFIEKVLHKGKSSSNSSSGKEHQRTASGASAGSSSSSAAAAGDVQQQRPGSSGAHSNSSSSSQQRHVNPTSAAAAAADAVDKGASSSKLVQQDAGPLFLDVQQEANGTTTTVERERQQQQQQQPQSEAPLATESHSAPLPAVPSSSTATPMAAPAAAGQEAAAAAISASSGGSSSGNKTPSPAAAAAVTPKAAAGSGNSVTFSPSSRSVSAGRAAGLSRRSMGALSLTHSLAGDSFKVRLNMGCNMFVAVAVTVVSRPCDWLVLSQLCFPSHEQLHDRPVGKQQNLSIPAIMRLSASISYTLVTGGCIHSNAVTCYMDCNMLQVRVGICAMDKKAKSKPMREIISRLEASGEFEVINFGDERILGAPITEWPRVDCLMSWYRCVFAVGWCCVDYAWVVRCWISVTSGGIQSNYLELTAS
jgi:hypothetical protein